jgi:hypothetical protein
MEATFFFDPACPWTWRTSRWLVTAAPARGATIRWRAFSLAILNEGRIPEQFRAPMEASSRALRLVEGLRADGRHDDIARFYTELGGLTHDAGEQMSDKAVDAAAEAAGIADAGRVLDDPTWDEAVRESHNTAMDSAGPDIGSPVLSLDEAERGLHGPILAEPPGEEEALRIWDAVVPLLRTPTFFEVKRGRR